MFVTLKRGFSGGGVSAAASVVLLCATLSSGGRAAARHAAVAPALERAAAEYDRAQVAGDRTALGRLLADDYRLVNSSAEVEDKAQLIADFVDPSFHLDPYVVENEIRTVWSDGAVLAGEVHLGGTSGGKRFEVHDRFVDVWRLRDGRWQVAYTQVTRVPTGK